MKLFRALYSRLLTTTKGHRQFFVGGGPQWLRRIECGAIADDRHDRRTISNLPMASPLHNVRFPKSGG